MALVTRVVHIIADVVAIVLCLPLHLHLLLLHLHLEFQLVGLLARDDHRVGRRQARHRLVVGAVV